MIRSTFSAFATAQSGLNASQRALDVTGHNMTNVNTEGYTRQRLDLVSVSAGGYTNRYGFIPTNEIGQGVAVNGVSRVRDPFLDVRFRREHARLGESDAQHATLSDIESIFNEIGVDGVGKSIEDLMSQLQKLADNTGSAEFDGIVRSSADIMAKLFNQYSRQLDQVREQEVYQLTDIDVPRVNTILENISSLNQSIREDQTYGHPSLELLDRRDLLIDELSQYINIDVKYTPVELARGITIEDVDIRMATYDVPAEYVDLIHNMDHATFSSSVDSATGQASVLVDSGAGAVDVTDQVDAGVFKGILDMLNKSGEFDAPPSDQKGIGYYTKTMDALANKFAEVMNAANAYRNPAYDPNAVPPAAEYLKDHPLFENMDDWSTNGITAKNLSVSQGWLNDDYGITTSKTNIPPDVSGARDNVLYIISQFDEDFSFETPGGDQVFEGTFQEFFSQIGHTLALDVKAKEQLALNNSTIVDGVLDLRDGVSAVNLDEEGINLLRYQKSYNAAARFMTTLDEALDKLINGTGLVGR